MLLYIIYNADLLDIIDNDNNEDAIGYVEDAALLATRATTTKPQPHGKTRRRISILSLTKCFTTIYWSLNYTTSTTKLYWWQVWFKRYGSRLPENLIISMKGEDGATMRPILKVPIVSPPCHAKVTLLMAEICDPMSAPDKPKCIFMESKVASQQKSENTLSFWKLDYLQLRRDLFTIRKDYHYWEKDTVVDYRNVQNYGQGVNSMLHEVEE